MQQKLNREDALQIIALYKSGTSAADIAEMYHVSRQRVYQILGSDVKRIRNSRKNAALEATPYVNLKAWLERRDTESYTSFIVDVFGGTNPVTMRRMEAVLSGSPRVALTIRAIRKMEEVTGMPFDQIFFKEDEPRDDE